MEHLNSNSFKAIQKLVDENEFKSFSRPLTGKLLEAMELNKNFVHGEGDYLFYEENGKTHRILDLTGGYGANFLGHRNAQILSKMKEWIDSGTSNLVQGSQRKKAGLLAKKLSELLTDETGEGPWITTFSNSGTEAIEGAMKHSLLAFRNRLTQLNQEIEKEINEATLKFNQEDGPSKNSILYNLRSGFTSLIEGLSFSNERKSYCLHQLSNIHDIKDLISFMREINSLQMNEKPLFVALEKAYHGKTLGSLSLTHNSSFRDPFYLGEEFNHSTIFISQYIDSEELQKVIYSLRRDLVGLRFEKGQFEFFKHSFSSIAAVFAEPIQGEAGVIKVQDDFLARIKKYSISENFLLIFDEIQAGLFRTGKLASGSHSNITADIYTFSKTLGGGVAKIGATTILKKKYCEEFGFLHTSTFSDDDFSSTIGLEVLSILKEGDQLQDALEAGQYLETRLEWLKDSFPEVIKEIRGKGLLLAIEFKNIFEELGFEFKLISDAKMQGYLLASALLNHEGIRISPSLSNNLTLRISPSIHFTIMQAEEFFVGIRNLCLALSNKEITYFLSALYPQEIIHSEKTPLLKNEFIPGERPLSVFLCHLIDDLHIKNVTRALKDVPSEKLTEKLAQTKDLAKFNIYHTQTLKDSSGQEMDIIMMGIPVTSEELKKSFLSKNKFKIIQKVQEAIDFAKELGANTVGLGQFTSIVSGNGLYLDPRGMNLTTGNAYTIGLTIQAAERSAKEKSLNLSEATTAIVGAAGNIMGVVSSLMAEKTQKLILIHHTSLDKSLKFQEAIKKIISEIVSSSANNFLSEKIKRHWSNEMSIVEFMQIPEIREVFVATSNIEKIKQADLVLCGASSSKSFLDVSLFKENAIVVDIAVPPSVKGTRPDLTYHMGGVAKIPNKMSIDFFILPLGENESYACMAETFAIGFSGEKDLLHIGDLNNDVVKKVEVLAKKAGFELGNYKTKSSL